MTIPKPFVGDYPGYFTAYIDRVGEDDVMRLLTENARLLPSFFEQLAPAVLDLRYADGKWTPREIFGHLIDAERVFQYRALRIGRGDATPLPGFDENEYVAAANAATRTIASLSEEYKLVRYSTIALFHSFDAAHWHQTGVASGCRVSVAALAYAILGHEIHHKNIIEERYR